MANPLGVEMLGNLVFCFCSGERFGVARPFEDGDV